MLEELQGRSRPMRRRQGFGLIDLLSESSETNLLSLADGVIINSGFEISELSEAVKPNGEPYPPEVVARAQELHAASGDPTMDPDDFLTQAEQELAPSSQGTASPPAPEPAPPEVVDAPTEETQADPDADANAADDAANAADDATAGADGTTPGVDTSTDVVQPIDGADADQDTGLVTAPDDDTDAVVDTGEDPGNVENPTPVAADEVSDDIVDTAGEDGGTPGPQPVDNEAEGPVLTNRQVADIHKAAIRNFKLPPESTNESFHNRSLIELLYGR